MKDRDPQFELLDELAADAPEERMRARFEDLLAERTSFGPRGRWAWAAAAAVLVIVSVLLFRLDEPAAPKSDALRTVIALLDSSSAFDRIRGANLAADLLDSHPSLAASLVDRLQRDESTNVRLAALEAMLARPRSVPVVDRWSESLLTQRTAVVQAHLGRRLRQRDLLSRDELTRILDRPEVLAEARNTLLALEDS